ncbi:unnamed protein product [Brugia timori]|uniref:Uncharacterized protein n=1 Tax=Brugia timori TaxID=42155 RepID=A0A0R3QT19_9BILA|nr:unnamed protein product [Brugia timori]
MPRKVPSQLESKVIDTSDNGDDLMTGISISQEKLTNHQPSNDNMENITMYKSSSSSSSSSNDHHSQSFFFNDDIIGQKYVETAKLPGMKHIHGTKIIWKKTQNVLELPILGHFQTYEKRVERSCPNPWRRHGALLKIYEIGGWISKMEKQQISRRDRKYFYVKAGSKPCNPPLRPPISIRESKFLPPSSVCIPSAINRSVDELAFIAAIQIQKAIQNSTSIFLDSQQNGGAGRDKIDIRNDYSIRRMNLGGRSSSVQHLSTRSTLPFSKNSRSRSMSLSSRKS